MYVDLAGLAFNAIIAGVVWFLIMPWVRMIQPRATLPFKLAAGAMLLTTATEFLAYGLLRFGPGMEIAAYIGFVCWPGFWGCLAWGVFQLAQPAEVQ
jgi:hypothetical protein